MTAKDGIGQDTFFVIPIIIELLYDKGCKKHLAIGIKLVREYLPGRMFAHQGMKGCCLAGKIGRKHPQDAESILHILIHIHNFFRNNP